jgi:hypothetical protein
VSDIGELGPRAVPVTMAAAVTCDAHVLFLLALAGGDERTLGRE